MLALGGVRGAWSQRGCLGSGSGLAERRGAPLQHLHQAARLALKNLAVVCSVGSAVVPEIGFEIKSFFL